MNRFFIYVLLLGLTLPVLSQPKLNIVGGVAPNFGNIYTGGLIKKSIPIVNDGSDTLVIDDVSTSCGCTAAMLSKSAIPAKDTGMLEITFDSKRFTGVVEKAITLKSNDPTQPKAKIIFSVNVNRLIELSTDYLVFNVATLNEKTSREITVTNTGSFPINLTSVTSTNEDVIVESNETNLQPGTKATLNCTIYPKHEGMVKGNIILKTDNEKVPELSIRFVGLAKNKNSNASH